jgi:hypothetical protein
MPSSFVPVVVCTASFLLLGERPRRLWRCERSSRHPGRSSGRAFRLPHHPFRGRGLRSLEHGDGFAVESHWGGLGGGLGGWRVSRPLMFLIGALACAGLTFAVASPYLDPATRQWGLTLTSARAHRQTVSTEYHFLRDRSVETLDRELPLVIERIRDAGLAPVFLIDELDKIDDLESSMAQLVQRMKHLVADYSFFCFLTDRDISSTCSICRGGRRTRESTLISVTACSFYIGPATYTPTWTSCFKSSPGSRRPLRSRAIRSASAPSPISCCIGR